MSRRLCFWIPIAVLCGSAGTSAAQPADTPITLWWEPPPGAQCPSGDLVLAEVERLLGGKPSASTGRRLFARARVAREDDGTWRLTLRTMIAREEADGERSLQAPTCDGLAGAAALIVALSFDPAAVAAQAERTALPSPPPAAKAESAPVSPPAAKHVVQRAALRPEARPGTRPKARAGSSSRVYPGVGGALGGDVGTFSTPAYSFRGWVGLRYRKLDFMATAAFFPVHNTRVPDRPTMGGNLTLITGGLSVCGAFLAFRGDSLLLAACGGAEGGQMHANGFGVRSPGEGTALWFALRGGGAFTAALPRVLGVQPGLRLDVGWAVPLARSLFYLDRIGPVYEPGIMSGRADVGAELHF